jgi:hypothetical protein
VATGEMRSFNVDNQMPASDLSGVTHDWQLAGGPVRFWPDIVQGIRQVPIAVEKVANVILPLIDGSHFERHAAID